MDIRDLPVGKREEFVDELRALADVMGSPESFARGSDARASWYDDFSARLQKLLVEKQVVSASPHPLDGLARTQYFHEKLKGLSETDQTEWEMKLWEFSNHEKGIFLRGWASGFNTCAWPLMGEDESWSEYLARWDERWEDSL